MLILKQNAANTVPTPPAGKGTIFLDDSDTLSVKTSDGNVENFPTVAASNSQVVFMNGTALSGEAALTYDFNNNVLNISGNVAAGNVKTDNLLYANGTPWDLSDPGGSNTEIQFNDDESFGGSAAFVFNKTSNLVTVAANLNANNLNATTHITSGNVWANSGTVGASLLTGTLTTAAQPNITSVGTLGSLAVTGNASAGNLSTGGELSVSGNAVINGNLSVNGNITYVNVDQLSIEDPVISLGGGPNGAPLTSNDGKDRGTLLHYYTSSAIDAFMGWDNSNGEFAFGSNVSISNDVATFNTLGNLRAGVLFANAAGLTDIPGGNIVGNISGNISNATHAVTANTVVDAAQPNITSVGTLSSLSVTGTATAGNLSTGGTLNVTGNANVGNLGTTGTITASGNISANYFIGNGSQLTGIDATAIQNGTANVRTFNNANVAISAAGNANIVVVTGTGAEITGALSVTTNLTAGNVYANSGTVGASLLTGTLTTASQPNITSVGTLGSLTISGNLSAGNAALGNAVAANYVTVNNDLVVLGSANIGGGTGGNISGVNNITANTFTGTLTTASQPNITSVGTLSSLDVSGNVSAGNMYANSGTIAASLLTGTLTTASQPNVTSLGTLSSLSVNGNITAANITANTGVFTGNGSGLSAIAGANVTGTVANATHSSTANTVVDAAQGNITSVGTLTGLSVDGSNITLANGIYVGNGSGLSALAGANVTGTVANATHSSTANTVVDAAQPNITSVGTLTSLSVTGNVSAGNVSGTLLTGTLATAAQPNVTSVGTLTGLTVDGSNITLANGVYVGNGSGLSALAGANVTGEVSFAATANAVAGANVSGQVANALVAGTVYTAAQPNITSVGTLTSLAVTGNASAGNISTGGVLSVTGNANVGNLGATGVVATTLGGTLTTAAQPNITSVGTLSSLTVTGTATAGNLSTGGTLSVTGNANVGNLGTAGLITATGNVSGGNLTTAGVVAATGNVSGGNLTTAGALSVTGNANTGNLGTTTLIATTGNITTINSGLLQNGNSNIAITANGNVSIQAAGSTVELVVTSTGANISGTLNATGNANVGNLGTAGLIVATGNVTGGNLTTAGALSVTGNANVGNIGGGSGVFTGTVSATGNVSGGNLTTTGILSVTGTGTSSIAGNLDMTSNNITNLASPVNSTDAATKQYVDDIAQGLHTHDSCNAATDGTLATISGGTVTYNNGTAGVGATLTTTGSYTTIDGVTLQNGMRILVKNEANAAHNGIYDRTSSTVLTRSSDFDTPTEMAGGDFTFVNGGTLYDNTGWVMTDPVTTVGTTDVNWVQFSGAGTYTAGTGLTLTGSQFSVNASQTQITSVGTLGSLTVSGNASAGNISTTGALSVTGNANVGNIGAAAGVFTSVSGNGSALTALNASNISTGTLAQARLANSTLTLGNTTLTLGATTTTVAGLTSVTSTTFVGALTGAATTAGTVTTAAQPNITSVGTLSSLAVTGNISAGNVSATTFTGALSGAATTAGTVTTAAQPNITSVGTLTGLTLAANADITMSGTGSNINGVALVSATLFAGSGANLTDLNGSNITTGTIAAARVATLNQNTTGYAATVSSAAQPNITSVGTLTSLGVNGTVTAVAFTANTGVFTGNGSGISAINGSNISTGTIAAARIATLNQNTTGYAATVSSAAQPNITSVGTLTGLTLANASTISVGSNTNVGTFTGNFSLSAGSRLNATYADLAEKYVADADYEPGTVLIFGGEHEVTISNSHDSHAVAGVVSTNPAYTMNSACEGEHVVDLALQGRVPVKVHGPVAKGDLMVSGPNGHAVANNMARAGTIIGKALENFEGGSGVIEVVVGRV